MAKTGTQSKGREYNAQKNINAVSIDLGKAPPQAIDVEEIVLGALMLEPNLAPDIMDTLSPECFYKEAHRKIFVAISSLAKRHAPIDIFTVAEELKKTNDLEGIGGAFFLGQLSSKIGAASHIEFHVKILAQKYIQRELISISYVVQRDSFDDSIPVDELLDEAQQKLFTLAERNIKKETQPISDVINMALGDIEKYQERTDGLSGVASGYTGVDRMTLGWQRSDLIILAARPAMGKTAFVLTMARNMSVEYNIPVAFFSLEMSSIQLVKRLMVGETGLSSDKIRGGRKLESHEWVQLNERLRDLSKAPLYIDDTPSLSINEFRSKARRLVKNAGVKVIVIDYLQLMTGPPELRGMREQEVSNISRSLKAVAKELDVPIIALSQLSRAVETRGGAKKPQLSDLRESGAIEQDADLVLFIHRPEYYGLNEDPAMKDVAEILIAKHRNGAVGEVKMKFRPSETKFVDFNDSEFEGFNFPNEQRKESIESKMNTLAADHSDFDNNEDF